MKESNNKKPSPLKNTPSIELDMAELNISQINKVTPSSESTVLLNPPSPLTISTSGNRSVVDITEAVEMIEAWKEEISRKQSEIDEYATNTKVSDPLPVCEKIILSNKSYKPDAAKHIADFLASISKDIKIADLSDIIASQPEADGLEVLSTLTDVLKSSPLKSVDLSDNALGSKGVSSCASILRSTSLEALYLCNNGLSEASMHEVADILIESGTCERLKSIHFYNNMSGAGGCEAFVRILENCSQLLEDIRFSGTRAGREESLVVANALKVLQSKTDCDLVHLDLADNSFGVEGAEALSAVVGSCPRLRYLDLRDCLLEDEGIEVICGAMVKENIVKSNSLRVLDVSGNEMTKDSGTVVASVLGALPSLEVFRAQDNELGSTGIKRIVAGLPGTLVELSLGFTECGSKGARSLIAAREKLSSLTKLNIDGNMIGPEEVESLTEAYGAILGSMEDNISDDDEETDVEECDI